MREVAASSYLRGFDKTRSPDRSGMDLLHLTRRCIGRPVRLPVTGRTTPIARLASLLMTHDRFFCACPNRADERCGTLHVQLRVGVSSRVDVRFSFSRHARSDLESPARPVTFKAINSMQQSGGKRLLPQLGILIKYGVSSIGRML
jgi:hypothetical protein